jgi:hypothetical protein
VASGVTRTSSDLSLPRRSEHGGVEQPATSAEGRAKTIAETLDLALNKQLSDLSKSNALISGMGMKSGGGESLLKRDPSSVTAAVVAAAAAQHAAEGVLGQSGRHDPKTFRSSSGMGSSASMAHLADAMAPKQPGQQQHSGQPPQHGSSGSLGSGAFPPPQQHAPQQQPPHGAPSMGSGAFPQQQQQQQQHAPQQSQQQMAPPAAPQMQPMAQQGAPPHISHLAPPSAHPAVQLPPASQHLAPPPLPPLPPHPPHPPPHGPSHI